MKKLSTGKVKKFVPVYEGWGKDRFVSDYRDENFIDFDPVFDSREDALRYAENNRGNYPFCTTGEVVMVELSMKIINSVKK